MQYSFYGPFIGRLTSQESNLMRETKEGFVGRYEFLSNFHIEPDGTHVEGEFQKAKATNDEDRDLFIGLDPYQSKVTGNAIKLRDDWEEVKYYIMQSLVEQKFRDHASLRRKLLNTGAIELIEYNTWNDTVWGVANGHGKNWLGKILMGVRSKLSKELSRSRAL